MSADNFMEDKPFFHSEELSTANKWWIGLYLLFTVIVMLVYDRIDVHYAHMMIIVYALLPQLFFCLILYGSLRNFRFYLLWLGFGVMHYAMYFILKNDPKLQRIEGNPAILLTNTIVMLLFFQLMRYASIKIQHKEFVAPNKSLDEKDDFDHRKITATDRLLFLAYFAVYGVLVYFWLGH